MRINDLIDTLRTSSSPLSEIQLTQLTELKLAERELLADIWNDLPKARRSGVIEQLALRSNAFLTNDIGVAIYNVETESDLKAKSLELIDVLESAGALEVMVNAALTAPEKSLRLDAIQQLGLCAYHVEIEEIEENLGDRAVAALFSLKKDPDMEIQQAALIAISYLSTDEVENWIKEAFVRQSISWQETALIAVGRNLSSEWNSRVIDGLYSKAPGIRQAAIISSGEMGLETARDRLIELLDEEMGSDLFEDVITALSKIGGENVQTIFEAIIANTDDEELQEFIQEALEELILTDPDSFKDYWADAFEDDDPHHDHDHGDDE